MPETPTSKPYISFETVFAKNAVESGFDLKPTISWVVANKEILRTKMESRIAEQNSLPDLSLTITPGENPDLSPDFITPLIGLVPEKLRELSACDQILGMNSLWFKKVEADQPIEPTDTIQEAISPTAIATGATTDEMHPPFLSVLLCKLPPDIIPDESVRKIMLGTAAIHEYFHTVTWRLLNEPQIEIELSDGHTVSGASYIRDRFGEAASQHTPISHYSRGYRNADNTFQVREGSTDLAIEEEFVESLTTSVLGFASGSLRDITTDPMDDRADIKKLCQDFLNARPASAVSEPTKQAA